MDILIAIIGSSAFTTVLTALFNLFQNKKKNSLSHITEERKLWREKIRAISEGIEHCEFDGLNEKNIEHFLVQLQMNINTYGKFSEYDYDQDGHIWKAIDNIKLAEDVRQFNLYKELLIFYLSLMLKHDWEKSKREVSGYSSVIKYISLYAVMSIVYAFYYFALWNIRNIAQFLLIIAIGGICPLFVKWVFIDEFKDIADSRKLINISMLKKRKVKLLKKIFLFFITIIFLAFFAYLYLSQSLSNSILENMRYNINNDNRIVLYTNFSKDIYKEFKDNIKYNIDIEVEDINKNYNFKDISTLQDEYKEQISVLIKKRIKQYNEIIIYCYLILLIIIAFKMSGERDKNDNYVELIRKANFHILEGGYKQHLVEAYNINLEVLKLYNENSKKRIVQLLALEYRVLNKVSAEIVNKTYKNEYESKNLNEFNNNENLKDELSVIKECLKILKDISYVKNSEYNGLLIILDKKLKELVKY